MKTIVLLSCCIVHLAFAITTPPAGVGEWDAPSQGQRTLHSLPPQIDFLREYVSSPDPLYTYNSMGDIDAGVYTVVNYFMTSQGWLKSTDTDVSQWNHWLQICYPKNNSTITDYAYLYVTGENTARPEDPPSTLDPLVEALCVGTGTITAVLYQVPNQPIEFYAEFPPIGRTEDALISYTFSHYLNATYQPTWKSYIDGARLEDAEWVAYLPMVKSAVKALDTIENVTGIGRFVVGGASKRGWTTWLTGGLGDERVIGITPVVAPVLDLHAQFQDMYQSYGEFSFALQDYVDAGLVPFFNSQPSMFDYIAFALPDAYTSAISAIPIYDVIASRDEFFMPDGAKYYWDTLDTQQKYLWIVPNAGHGMAGAEEVIAQSIGTFYAAVGMGLPLPTLSWNISSDGHTLFVSTSESDASRVVARLWLSENNADRDWRLFTCYSDECYNPNGTFTSTTLEPAMAPGGGGGTLTYAFTLDANAVAPNHYTAFYIELEYNVSGSPLYLSSDMSIVPQSYPHPPCPTDVCACAMSCSSGDGDGDGDSRRHWVSPGGVVGISLVSCCVGVVCAVLPMLACALLVNGWKAAPYVETIARGGSSYEKV